MRMILHRFGHVALLTTALLASISSDARHSTPLQGAGDDWLRFGGSDTENHFSTLAEINDRNIGRLKLLWFVDLDPVPSVNSAPLAVGGTLYFAIGYSIVHAMDAATGHLLWKYDPEVYAHAGSKLRMGWGVRGIAYRDGQVFTGTLDGRLLALDAHTGHVNWSVQTTEPDDARYILERSKGLHGFYGASSMERLPAEAATLPASSS